MQGLHFGFEISSKLPICTVTVTVHTFNKTNRVNWPQKCSMRFDAIHFLHECTCIIVHTPNYTRID